MCLSTEPQYKRGTLVTTLRHQHSHAFLFTYRVVGLTPKQGVQTTPPDGAEVDVGSASVWCCQDHGYVPEQKSWWCLLNWGTSGIQGWICKCVGV